MNCQKSNLRCYLLMPEYADFPLVVHPTTKQGTPQSSVVGQWPFDSVVEVFSSPDKLIWPTNNQSVLIITTDICEELSRDLADCFYRDGAQSVFESSEDHHGDITFAPVRRYSSDCSGAQQ